MFRGWLSTGSHSAPCWWWPTRPKQLSRVGVLTQWRLSFWHTHTHTHTAWHFSSRASRSKLFVACLLDWPGFVEHMSCDCVFCEHSSEGFMFCGWTTVFDSWRCVLCCFAAEDALREESGGRLAAVGFSTSSLEIFFASSRLKTTLWSSHAFDWWWRWRRNVSFFLSLSLSLHVYLSSPPFFSCSLLGQ